MAAFAETWRRVAHNDQLLRFFLAVAVGTAAIGFEDFADAVLEPEHDQPPTARDLVHRIPEALLPEDDLETALRLCEMNQEEHMPVVDNRERRKVIGEVRYQDLVLAYNRALLAARAAERGES